MNLAKTQILSSMEVRHHFCFAQNVTLDKIDLRLKKGRVTVQDCAELDEIFAASLSSPAKNADKVTKRTLRILASLNLELPSPLIRRLFVESAELRENVAGHLAKLGYSYARGRLLLKIATDARALDDGARFAVKDVVLAWDVSSDATGVDFVTALLSCVKEYAGEVGFCTALAVFAKFAPPNKLLSFLESKRRIWEASSFAHRQVISVLPRLMNYRPYKVERYLVDALNCGKADVVSVAKNLFDLAELTGMSPEIRMAFFPTNAAGSPYPLSKFLILKWMYHHGVTASHQTQADIEKQIGDRWYTSALQA
ncbi:hypothetical protein FN976_27910 [Caenimonas sedimenti]|uniref:Uncharacterized protein n=1 Tax=Caenimonas sedimenti TaxID=2596921 RepID=A0A562ZES0_9BURK|nr:hypothetical protein [Caenimonas sedimenti]TWO64929.1 hypothetical protein FN976_27910 [Caenimonas sedimenti]